MTTPISRSSPTFERAQYLRLELAIDRDIRFRSNADAVALFQQTGMHKSPQETFWVLTYGAQLNVGALFEVGRGGYLSVDLHMPSLMAGILTAGTERFVLAHNHPSNDLTPSEHDMKVTQAVMDAANTLRLLFEEHYILTPDGRHYSFTNNGLLVPDLESLYYDKSTRAAKAATRSRR